MDNYDQFAQQFSEFSPLQQGVFIAVICFIVVLGIIAEWKIFKKAGQRGWYSLIPILREYKICEIVDGNGIKFLLLCVPFVSFIYGILLCFRMAKAYGKGTGFGFGLLFLPNIFMLILGFGSAEYLGPRGQR